MKRKKYSMQKEEDKELTLIDQQYEQYEVNDDKTKESTKWTKQNNSNS